MAKREHLNILRQGVRVWNTWRASYPQISPDLKSADFFNVNEHPKATFESTAIEEAGEGQVNITGDFTLLDVTKSITFSATVGTDDGLALKAEFTIDRTDFGMNFGLEMVEKEVKMTVTMPK